MTVLVTGGAGYIGSHTAVELLNAGHDVVIADDFRNSEKSVLGRITLLTGKMPTVYPIDVCDKGAVDTIFALEDIDAVIHFAGLKAVGESVSVPLSYYRNNIDSVLTVLEAMRCHGCKKIVFSSSATVYGPDNPVPYTEDMMTSATNPYGWTKVMIEQILRDAAKADADLSVVSLRYFNPIGSHESGLLGDKPCGTPNNLMPNITAAASGSDALRVLGDDYETPDGTGVRDYIHVCDLAEGHIKALEYIDTHTGCTEINLGTGKGTSVLELIKSFERVNGVRVPYTVEGRRPGDLAECYASAELAKKLLNWQARRTIDDMCASAWRFEKFTKETAEP